MIKVIHIEDESKTSFNSIVDVVYENVDDKSQSQAIAFAKNGKLVLPEIGKTFADADELIKSVKG